MGRRRCEFGARLGHLAKATWLPLLLAVGCSQPSTANQDREQLGDEVLHQLGRCNALWNTQDRDSLAACYASGAKRSYVAALPETVLEGADAIADNDAAFWRAVPDAQRLIEIAIASPREVVIVFRVTGKHSEELAGIAATNKQLSYRIAMWVELDENGLITREHLWADATTQHAQLGIELRRAPPLKESMRDVSVSLSSSGAATERQHHALFEQHNSARLSGDWSGLASTLDERASWRSVNWEGSNEGRDKVIHFARVRYIKGIPSRTINAWVAAGPWLAVRFTDPFPASDAQDPRVGRREPGDILAFFRIQDGRLVERLSFENPTRWWADGRGLDPSSLRFGGL